MKPVLATLEHVAQSYHKSLETYTEHANCTPIEHAEHADLRALIRCNLRADIDHAPNRLKIGALESQGKSEP